MTFPQLEPVPLTSPWRRPRGQRRTPSRRARAPRDPYGREHRAIRAYLMGLLAATGPWPCPICGEPMLAAMGRALHLHHSDERAKLAGLPGDQLAHAACNLSSGGQLGAAITNNGAAPPGMGRPSRVW